MPILTILFGVALMTVGVGTYIGAGENADIWTFILQMILGLLAVGMGVGSMAKKQMRMHLMHGAALLAAMGVIVPTIKFGMYLFELPREDQMNLLRALLTVAFSGAYILFAVRSFRAARKDGKTATAGKAEPPPPASEPEPEPEPTPDE